MAQHNSPLNLGTGISPQKGMLAALLNLAKEVVRAKPAELLHHKRNAGMLVRRVKIMSMLFEELSLSEDPLPPSAWLCLTEMSMAMNKAKLLLQDFRDRSSTCFIIYSNITLSLFQELAQTMSNALDILPLQLLDVPLDVKEQAELIHTQLKRGPKPCEEPSDTRLRVALLSAFQDMERLADCDTVKMRWILDTLHMSTPSSCLREIQLLEREITLQAGTGGLVVISTINRLITFLGYAKRFFFGQESSQDVNQQHCLNSITSDDGRMTPSFTCPDEFRCPISLELMTDPVIIATGHTYEKVSISKWLESGHSTCPRSGQKLLHTSLIPNYALKSLIAQWCMHNDIPLASTESNKYIWPTMDNLAFTQGVINDAKLTAAFLVGKLAMGAPDIQRQVAYELRLLAKSGLHNRVCIAEAGAIPFLVPLLLSKDPKTQEHAITALLNVSLYEQNKALIMAAGALDAIVHVLKKGANMESRENAAAALFSLSVVNKYKVEIGNTPLAIPSLIRLLMEGSTRGKKDAASALFNLSIFEGNKAKVVEADAIPVLVHLLTDEMACITDDALAVLAVLAPCVEGLAEMKKTQAIPLLVDLVGFGSTKGKENSIAVLLALCKTGGEEVVRSVLSLPSALPYLERLLSSGTPRAKRKANALMKILVRPPEAAHHGN
ncbi:hypothetical protein L7F22_027532 [Adiantum nelumboides]|nr:hypothetical protein [Adiantum nelumboides]